MRYKSYYLVRYLPLRAAVSQKKRGIRVEKEKERSSRERLNKVSRVEIAGDEVSLPVFRDKI